MQRSKAHFVLFLALGATVLGVKMERDVFAQKKLTFTPPRWMSLAKSGLSEQKPTFEKVKLTPTRTDNILLSPHSAKGVAVLTINRPGKSNALSPQTIEDMLHVVATLDPSVRVLVLTGAGEKMFSAGGDLSIAQTLTGQQALKYVTDVHNLAFLLEDSPIFTVGKVNGGARGGALQLLAALDAILVRKDAEFAQSEVQVGLPIGWGGKSRLPPRFRDPSIAYSLMETGKRFTGEQGAEWGLFTEAVPPEALENAVSRYFKYGLFSPGEVQMRKRKLDVPFVDYVDQRNEFVAPFESGEAPKRIEEALEKLAARKKNQSR